MKTIFTIIGLLITTSVGSSYIKYPYKRQIDKTLLYNTMWREARGLIEEEEFRIVLECIKNRIKHEDFPSTLDSVLLQPNQFETKNLKPLNKEFKDKVDSLWKLPIKYNHLYFRSKGYKFSPWMKKYKWQRINNSKHEFGK